MKYRVQNIEYSEFEEARDDARMAAYALGETAAIIEKLEENRWQKIAIPLTLPWTRAGGRG